MHKQELEKIFKSYKQIAMNRTFYNQLTCEQMELATQIHCKFELLMSTFDPEYLHENYTQFVEPISSN